MTNIMIDLETLGNRPGCIVLSIGAVEFNESGTHGEFYVEISQVTSEQHGLRADISTLKWWKEQNTDAQQVVIRTGNPNNEGVHPLRHALTKLQTWMPQDALVWGNGASFDNIILAECFKACGIEAPWKFWNDRCYRTLKNLFQEVPFERSGTHHNSLDDARSQAIHASAILKWLEDTRMSRG